MDTVQAYCNLTITTGCGKKQTIDSIPSQLVPAGTNHKELLASLFQAKKVPSNLSPNSFTITSCKKLGPRETIYNIGIKPKNNNFKSAKDLASLMISYRQSKD